MDNYPPGAKYDKRAPYNNPTYIVCPACDGRGELEEGVPCDNCLETGSVED